ncbi:hypothetical protein BGZ63DRAFT_516801 [Mariannaea sp. PMI_226]|nr:hypothetical protein BGZ63DRAFT_516801 [Mariannaea sp. PMI_226]
MTVSSRYLLVACATLAAAQGNQLDPRASIIPIFGPGGEMNIVHPGSNGGQSVPPAGTPIGTPIGTPMATPPVATPVGTPPPADDPPSTTTEQSNPPAETNSGSTSGVNPNAQGACEKTTGGANACGPNGSQAWLNTGITGNGWNPPFLDINNISHIALPDYYENAGAKCKKYDEQFQNSGKKYNIDPAILAFIAMQESSCNADAGGSTPGLMQCDPGNCPNGAPCVEVNANVDCGAKVLRDALDQADGNAVHAFGAYNGWFTASDDTGLNGGKGLTEDYPCTEGRKHGDPQNLNYMHELFNGWFQGYDIYGANSDLAGKYNCDQNCDDGSKC